MSLLGPSGDTAWRNLTQPKNGAPVTTEKASAPNALDIALDALRLIDRTQRCENSRRGRCYDAHSGRERGARYGDESWCDSCIAADALNRMTTGEPVTPSWQQILTAERDEAIDRADRVVAVAQHMADAQQRLRVAAEAVLAVPEKTVDNVKELARG